MLLRRKRNRDSEVAPPEHQTDARPAGGEGGVASADPEIERRRRFRRRVTTSILCAVFVAGSATALFGKGGFFELVRLRRECRNVAASLETQRARVAALEAKIDRLKHDPMARERIAREQLGYQKPGEVTFLLPKPVGAPAPRSSANPR